MEKLIIILLTIILITACQDEVVVIKQQPIQKYKTETYYKVVKATKEVTEQETDYHYKYDVLNGKFRQQPRVYSITKYYIIYTDGTHDETTMDKFVFYSSGDSIKFYKQISIN